MSKPGRPLLESPWLSCKGWKGKYYLKLQLKVVGVQHTFKQAC